MKVERVHFVPGGMPQFWKGEEERRSRLEACKGGNERPVVEMELLPNIGGYIRLMYNGTGPFFIGPNMISGIVPAKDEDVPTTPATPTAKEATKK